MVRFFIVGFVIISLVFIGSTAALYVILNREKAEKGVLQETLAQVMRERKKLSQELDEVKLIKSDLERELSGLEVQAKLLAENYEKEKSQNDVVRLKLSKTAEGFKLAKAEAKKAVADKERLQGMLEDEKKKYNLLKDRVEKLAEVKNVLEEKVREIVNKQGVELERIVVKAVGELEGKVLVINRDYNFLVVNLGMQDDVELGNYLTIFRNGKFVGEAQVEKIYDTMSAASIIKESKPKAIMINDNVIMRGN